MRRTKIEPHRPGFEVQVYVEGYRPDKDVWLYETYRYDTLLEAIDFVRRVSFATWESRQTILGFEAATKETGWYGLSFEYVEVYEYTCAGETYLLEDVLKGD